MTAIPQASSQGWNISMGFGTSLVTDAFVRTHFRGVLAVCLAHAESRQDAEDAAQEVFLKAHASAGSLRDPAKVRAWLFQIARRLCADHRRRRRKTVALPAELPGKSSPADPGVDRLQAALARLPREYAEPLLLRYVEGRSCAEIADDLGISPSAARVRLCRGRLKLRDWLAREKP